jgi:hypothetical protein
MHVKSFNERSLSAVVTLLFIASLVLRIFIGIDLTDEMQYYLQILGMVETNSLFSNDLYIQQLVYLLFYPFFKLYYTLIGDAGLVVFGRSLYAFCLIGLYIFSNKILCRVGINPLVSSVAAFALCLAPSFAGIFAINYNTISQFGWCIIMLIIAFQVNVSSLFWAVIICITGLAHPPGGIALASICAYMHLIISDTNKLCRIISLTVLITVITIVVLAWLSGGFEQLHRAFLFTKGFSAGDTFFEIDSLINIGIVIFLLIFAIFFPAFKRASIPLIVFNLLFGLVCIFIIFAQRAELTNIGSWGFSYNINILKLWLIFSIVYIYTARCVWSNSKEVNSIMKRLVYVSIIQLIVLTGTSSNGVNYIIGALAILLPIVAALPAFKKPFIKNRTITILPVITVLIWVLSLMVYYPYRQVPINNTERGLSNVPMFSGLFINKTILDFSDGLRNEISYLIKGSPGMIISDIPGIYPILGVRPSTCMLYNHSLGTQSTAALLADCLIDREMLFVAHFHSNETNFNELRKHKLLHTIANLRSLKCDNHRLELPSAAPNHFTHTILTLCD